MPDTAYLLTAVVLAASIPFASRALPFAIIEPLRAFQLAAALARRMPAGLMLILVVYLLRDAPQQTPAVAITTLGAALLVTVLHVWRSNGLVSIFAGAAAYVLATNLPVASPPWT